LSRRCRGSPPLEKSTKFVRTRQHNRSGQVASVTPDSHPPEAVNRVEVGTGHPTAGIAHQSRVEPEHLRLRHDLAPSARRIRSHQVGDARSSTSRSGRKAGGLHRKPPTPFGRIGKSFPGRPTVPPRLAETAKCKAALHHNPAACWSGLANAGGQETADCRQIVSFPGYGHQSCESNRAAARRLTLTRNVRHKDRSDDSV
jgi:hypothetical protein